MSSPPSDDAARRLLLELGAAGLASGRAVHDVEREVQRVGAALGLPDAQAAATPTGIFVSVSPDAAAGFVAVGPLLRFDQVARVEAITGDLQAGRLDAAAGLRALQEVPRTAPRVPRPVVALAYVPLVVGVALIIQPTVASVAVAAVAALVVVALDLIADRVALLRTLLPVLAAFGTGCVVFLATELELLDAPLRTALSAIAPLLPGALIVTGMSELAQGAMVAGTARLTYGAVQLLLLTFGVFVAARVVGLEPDLLTNVRMDDLGVAATAAGLLIVGAGVYVSFSAPPGVLVWMVLGLVVTAAAQAAGQAVAGPPLGGFAGGLTAALLAALVHRLPNGPPALPVFLPAFWLLVPGSLGVATATEIATSGAAGFATAIGAVAAVLAIALGVLVGSAIGEATPHRRASPAQAL